jgi:DnaK suppressor protein
MNSEYKEQIRQLLEAKYEKLIKQIAELKDLVIPEALDSAVGRVSRMDAINNRSINEAALRKKSIQLDSIQNALSKIDKPEFGICVRCGKTIPKERILFMPESKVCVDCAR